MSMIQDVRNVCHSHAVKVQCCHLAKMSAIILFS